MDDLQIEEVIEIIPICGPDPKCVDEYITQNGIHEVLYQNTRSTTSDEFDISVSETVLVNGTTAHASAQVQTDVARFDGYFVFALTENGWVFGKKWRNFHVTNYTAYDTSRLGHFIIDNDMYYDLEMEEYIIFDSFDIEILSVEGTTVTYNLNSCSMRTFDDSVEMGQQQAAFDPFSGKFSVGTYNNVLGANPMLVCYDRYSNGWDVIESSLKKSP